MWWWLDGQRWLASFKHDKPLTEGTWEIRTVGVGCGYGQEVPEDVVYNVPVVVVDEMVGDTKDGRTRGIDEEKYE